MKRERLVQLLNQFNKLRITVIGDLFLDRWYEIDERLNSLSIETNLTVYHVTHKRSAPGAAGTVLNNLSGMDVGTMRVISMVGDDGDGWEMLKCLKDHRVGTDAVISSAEIVTPSYIKPLFPAEGNRFDIENLEHTPKAIEDLLIQYIQAELVNADALIVMDQVAIPNTGVMTERVRTFLCQLARASPSKLIVADSRINIDQYTDVVVKCNNFEAASIAGYAGEKDEFNLAEVFASIDKIRRYTGKPVVVTCNKHGIAIVENGEYKLLPAVTHDCPIDICGAGDACTAGFVSTLAAGGSYAEAAFIGNLSSGVTVRQIGCTGTATQKAMMALYDEQFGE